MGTTLHLPHNLNSIMLSLFEIFSSSAQLHLLKLTSLDHSGRQFVAGNYSRKCFCSDQTKYTTEHGILLNSIFTKYSFWRENGTEVWLKIFQFHSINH